MLYLCSLILRGRLRIEKKSGGRSVIFYSSLFLFSVIILDSVLDGKMTENGRELDRRWRKPWCVVWKLV